MTEKLFLSDPSLAEAYARVQEVRDRAIVLDRTIFYATSGGQPGDTGTIAGARVTGATYDQDRQTILHHIQEGVVLPPVGAEVPMAIDPERRLGHSRMHTACHLLSALCPFPITGASVGEAEARVDFDMIGSLDKVELTERLRSLIEADHPVFTRWISEAELDANPGLVKSKNVRPPRGTGQVRLVCIGTESAVDSQPCGGTHVASTGQIGSLHVAKVEKKGRENRRVRLRAGPPSA